MRWIPTLSIVMLVVMPAGGGASVRHPERGATIGVVRHHLAYEAAVLDVAVRRLAGADQRAALAVRTAVSSVDPTLAHAMAAGQVSNAATGAEWDELIGTGAPRPGEASGHYCSLGARRSDIDELGTTPAPELAEELASIEMGLLVEGRQLVGALPPSLRPSVDETQRAALHTLAPLLIPTDRSFASGA